MNRFFIALVALFVVAACGDKLSDSESNARRENWPQRYIPPNTDEKMGNYIGSVNLDEVHNDASQFHSIIRPTIRSINIFFYIKGLRFEINDSGSQSGEIALIDFDSTSECYKYTYGNLEVVLGVLSGFAGSDYYVLFKNSGESPWKNLGHLATHPAIQDSPTNCRLHNINADGGISAILSNS